VSSRRRTHSTEGMRVLSLDEIAAIEQRGKRKHKLDFSPAELERMRLRISAGDEMQTTLRSFAWFLRILSNRDQYTDNAYCVRLAGEHHERMIEDWPDA
jgi:hypothetical protein